jgi:cysteine desulfurase/selenocysteine lyase
LAKAAQILEQIGWDNLINHETALLNYTLNKLQQIPKLILYQHCSNRSIGVISFNIQGAEHYQVAKYLAETRGIGVRSGCFCARGYVQSLLKLSPIEIDRIQSRLIDNIQAQTPGMVRISFGCYNKFSEVDCLVDALEEFCLKMRKQGGYPST